MVNGLRQSQAQLLMSSAHRILSRSSEDTNAAIAVAQRAFTTFQHTTPKERARILQKWSDLMTEHLETLAKILMYENGRPIAGARQEIQYAAGFFDWFRGEAERSYGYTATGTTPGNRVITIQQPVGVVGVLTPWNFPSAMITRKIAGAIAAGCTVVLKPAAETPYSALALAELGERAGIPKGVFNVVTTNKHVQEVGTAVTTHKDVKKISFTGSTRVGKLLMAQASSTMKKCSFELGGNAPFIVFHDADLEKTMTGLLAGKFRGSGQTCVSPNRIYVQSGIYDAFIARFTKQVRKQMRTGVVEDDQTTLGCVINSKALDKIEHLVADAKSKGAEAVIGGERGMDFPSNLYPATILTNMNSEMEASQTEMFGPVATVYRFDTEKDVIAQANQSEVGLAAYVYTENLPVAWRVAEALQGDAASH
ncbi:succinate semialdehyde dehydrogenase NADP+ linked [Imshaugia aleurites]|uniref:succinate-semialdehyde dehydrogenase [NAD(P)(+)] n=1 Tax=Imshaugia aleurites TaxID=172621 RepID=A0A8H3IH52_9LECA|nr:succinate semialdehyde dehydrogenase NADP+ linked [Imshaugia aleurites]